MFGISVLSSNNSCSVEGRMPADVIKLCVCLGERSFEPETESRDTETVLIFSLWSNFQPPCYCCI